MNAANVIIFLTVPHTLRAVNLTLRGFNSLKPIVIWRSSFYYFLNRPTLVLEVVLSCRLVLNLRSTAGKISAFQPKPGVLPWSDNSKTRTYTYPYPSSSIIVGNQSRSSDIQGTSTLGRETKLEPNRARPDESIWNAETLYTTFWIWNVRNRFRFYGFIVERHHFMPVISRNR